MKCEHGFEQCGICHDKSGSLHPKQQISTCCDLLSAGEIRKLASKHLDKGLYFGSGRIYRCTEDEIVSLVRDVERSCADRLADLAKILAWARVDDDDAMDGFGRGYEAARRWVQMFDR